MANKLDINKIKEKYSGSRGLDFATPNEDDAIFLPSISSLYAKHVSKDDADIRNGDIPAGMTSIDDLDFLAPDKGIYWYPWALYSAGHACLDLTKTDVQEKMIQKRDHESTLIVGDSGGYQLSTGVLKGYMGDLKSMDEDEASMRHKIMKWLEYTADYSMILDIPTTSVANSRSFIFKNHFNAIPENIDGINKVREIIKSEGTADHLKQFESLVKSDPHEIQVVFPTETSKANVRFISPDPKVMFFDCLQYTIYNCEYFIKHRVPGKTKFLNVLQGRDIQNAALDDPEGVNYLQHGEGQIWWNVVKHFNKSSSNLKTVKEWFNKVLHENSVVEIDPIEIHDDDEIAFGDRAFEGWAIPGNLKFDFQMLMKRFKMMHDEGYFDDTGEPLLIHFLGISRISAGLLYTTLQNEMKKYINENIIITYDAASPFVCTAKGKGYSQYTVSNEKLSYKMDPLPDKDAKIFSRLLTNDPKNISSMVWQQYPDTHDNTVLGQMLTIGDICYKDGTDSKSLWDGTSYVYIMNMNVEQHIKAIHEAYAHYRKPKSHREAHLPNRILRGRVAIEDIVRNKFNFNTDDFLLMLPELKKVLGMTAQEVTGVNELGLVVDSDDESKFIIDAEGADDDMGTEIKSKTKVVVDQDTFFNLFTTVSEDSNDS